MCLCIHWVVQNTKQHFSSSMPVVFTLSALLFLFFLTLVCSEKAPYYQYCKVWGGSFQFIWLKCACIQRWEGTRLYTEILLSIWVWCFTCAWAGGCNYHNLLNSRANPNKNYIFGALTLRTTDWYINELILRGLRGGGGRGGLTIGKGLQNFTGPLSRNINIFLESLAQA